MSHESRVGYCPDAPGKKQLLLPRWYAPPGAVEGAFYLDLPTKTLRLLQADPAGACGLCVLEAADHHALALHHSTLSDVRA